MSGIQQSSSPLKSSQLPDPDGSTESTLEIIDDGQALMAEQILSERSVQPINHDELLKYLETRPEYQPDLYPFLSLEQLLAVLPHSIYCNFRRSQYK